MLFSVKKGVCSLLLLLVMPLFAEARIPVPVDLYTALIPVQSESASDYNKAASYALVEVLAKSSGKTSEEIDSISALATDIRQAHRWVAQFHYERATEPNEGLRLRVTFSEKYVLGLLQLARLSYWPASRPAPLLFAITQTGGNWVLLNHQEAFIEKVQQIGATYGLQFSLPDEAELKRVSLQALAYVDQTKLISTFSDSLPDGVMVLQVNPLAFNTVELNWTLLTQDDLKSSREVGGSLDAALDSFYQKLVTHWSPAQVIDLKSQHNEYMLSVDNVRTHGESLQVIAFLESLTEVNSVFVTAIEGERVNLAVSLNTTWEKFVHALERSQKFEKELQSSDAYMHYYSWKGL